MAADRARVLLEAPLDPLLELADPQHLGVHPDQPVVVKLGYVLAVAHRKAPLVSRDSRAELPDGRLVRSLKLLFDRQTAELAREHLNAPRPLVANLTADLDVARDVELALAGQAPMIDRLIDQ